MPGLLDHVEDDISPRAEGGVEDLDDDGGADHEGQQPEEVSNVFLPQGPKKNWRACLNCKLLQSLEQFAQIGCGNCPHSRFQERDPQEILVYTTQDWQGIIANFNIGNSWLKRATQLRGEQQVYGMYAVRATDPIDPEARQQLQEEDGGLDEDMDFIDDTELGM